MPVRDLVQLCLPILHHASAFARDAFLYATRLCPVLRRMVRILSVPSISCDSRGS